MGAVKPSRPSDIPPWEGGELFEAALLPLWEIVK